MASSKHDVSIIRSCEIIPLECTNVSDHLPLRLTLQLVHCPATVSQSTQPAHKVQQHVIHNWSKPECNSSYQTILDMALDDIPPINDKTDRDALLESIEDQMDQIYDAMHKAAKQGNCSRSPFKPKAYWCPERSRLCDRKRFWWFLWTQNDRPRQGILYECYKGVKKLFRQTSRKAVDNTLNNNHAKLNSFYKIRNMRGFWNSIKHRKLKSFPSTLTANDFVEHFKSIMQDDNNLSPSQTAIDKEV